MPDFPRLLVATEFPPNGPGGGAAIVRQMLQDWPPDRLHWWSFRPDLDRNFGLRVATHDVAHLPERLNPIRRALGPKRWLLDKFWTPWATRHLHRTLARVNPDVVWAIPHSWSIPLLARALPAHGVPFHVSIHDYPDVRGMVNLLGAPLCRRFAVLLDQIYARSASRDTVSREMTADLHARTGAQGGLNRAGLEPEDFAGLAAASPPVGNAIRIAYAGSILVEPEFALFAGALEKIRHDLPRPLSFELFGDHSYQSRPWFIASWMHEHGHLPRAELSSALSHCTWGFSPMALTDDDPRYNRFSLPTKLVSYLAAGLPVITLGHPESTVVKMASAYPMGFCSSAAGVETLASQLLAVLTEPNPATKYRAGIRQCAAQEFDAAQLRAALHENFHRIAVARSPKN